MQRCKRAAIALLVACWLSSAALGQTTTTPAPANTVNAVVEHEAKQKKADLEAEKTAAETRHWARSYRAVIGLVIIGLVGLYLLRRKQVARDSLQPLPPPE